MKYQAPTLASGAFKSLAMKSGYQRLDVAFDKNESPKHFWLSPDGYACASNMLKENKDPEDYCLDLAFQCHAFYEW